eukprot:1853986-Pyramimonas_sp.AAC.1
MIFTARLSRWINEAYIRSSLRLDTHGGNVHVMRCKDGEFHKVYNTCVRGNRFWNPCENKNSEGFRHADATTRTYALRPMCCRGFWRQHARISVRLDIFPGPKAVEGFWRARATTRACALRP